MSEVKKIKPSLSKGTRDFLPQEVAKRNYIFDTIKAVFRKYGFEQIETPAIERLETLTGKYGEEGDKLLFKILESGDFLEKVRRNQSIVNRVSRIQNFLNDVLTGLAKRAFTDKIYQETKEIDRLYRIYDNAYRHEVFNWDLYLGEEYKYAAIDYFTNNATTIVNALHRVFAGRNTSNEREFRHYLRVFRDLVIVERLLPQMLDYINYKEVTNDLVEKGLRYDLTVPLARYVVQHQDKLAFPFKRFHIGPVWRADRPQKGRYQEFYQCDADVIGSSSLLNEVELTRIYVEVFENLGMKVVVRVNNRKILEALSFLFLRNSQDDVVNNESSSKKFSDFVTTLDKLDKIGEDGVTKEFINKGYDSDRINALSEFLWEVNRRKLPLERLSFLKEHMNFSAFTPIGSTKTGLEELDYVFKLLSDRGNVELDLTLARGLDYYTGLIWEIQPAVGFLNENQKIGSLGGGGRYDNLTEMFGGQNMSGVGISFGIERIYDVMEELNLFPAAIAQGVKVLFVPRDGEVEEFTFQQVQTLRNAGIPAEIFLGNVKKQKHFTYAEQKGIPYMVEIGGNEMESKQFRLRNVKERREEGNGYTTEALVHKFR